MRFRNLIGSATLAVLCAAQLCRPATAASSDLPNLNPAELFRTTNIWNIHLRFSPDQWEAMEPKGGFGPFGRGGGPGRFGGPREGGPGRGGPGPFGGFGGRGGPGGPGGFSIAMLLSPAFLSQGDLDRDGRLSRQEFGALAEKWFAAWDTNHAGRLDSGKIRAGLNAAARLPGGGGRGGFPGPGLMLQGPEGKRNGLASAMGIEFEYVHADLEFEGRLLKDVAVRYKGNGTFMESRASLKRSLKVNLNKFVKGQNVGGESMLTLQNNVTDASWMNEVLAYELYRDAGVPAPRTAYARVYVTVPGKFDRQYLGLYSLSETVDKRFAQDRFGTRKGAIFKPVTPNLFADLGPDWSRYKQTYDPKTELSDEAKKAVIDLCQLVTHGDDAEFSARIGQYIELPEFARFMAVMVWLSDLDGILGPGQNLYLHWDPRTQQFEFIPWDQDHSFGQFGRASQEQRDGLSIHKPWQGENRFLERMYGVEAFKKLYLARIEDFSKTIFRPERFARQVDDIARVIRPAVQEETNSRVARFDQAVAGEILGGGGFGPFGGSGIKPIKPFAVVRTQSVIDQLAGKSEGLTLDGGWGPPQRGGPGGPDGFGPGMIFGTPFLEALDRDKDSLVTPDEFKRGFAAWFDAWNTDQSGRLTEEQLRSGIDKDLSPFRGGFPGFGPPPGGPGGVPGGPDGPDGPDEE